jgi:hypothetical protein
MERETEESLVAKRYDEPCVACLNSCLNAVSIRASNRQPVAIPDIGKNPMNHVLTRSDDAKCLVNDELERGRERRRLELAKLMFCH